MARKIWTGSINFGLVTIPVGLYSATEDHTISFHQYERGTNDRVRYKRVNERTGEEVDYNDIVKGREVGGALVTVDQKELDEIAPGRSRTIDITTFVDLDEIDPVYFQKTYWLAPNNKEHYRPYNLLRRAMSETNQAGIATFVLRGKAYLTAVRADETALALNTLFFADEIRDPGELVEDAPATGEPTEKEIQMATTVIESMSGEWEPEEYEDTYTTRVEQLIEEKSQGRTPEVAEEPPQPTDVIDLTDALRRSVDHARKGRSDRREKQREAEPVQDVHNLSKSELEKKAKELGIRGRSKMNRAELEEAVAGSTAEGGRGRGSRRAS
ncbi:non-homologous end joining protein Ku [Parasphingorhabdus pacifica]